MALEVIPDWMVNLDDEDVSFIKRFLLASGSLKEMAKQYEVTYPTVRLGLARWTHRPAPMTSWILTRRSC